MTAFSPHASIFGLGLARDSHNDRLWNGGGHGNDCSALSPTRVGGNCGNLREAESMPFRSLDSDGYYGCARSELSIPSVMRSGSLVASLGFSSITRNANARANFFQNPAHVEKDCFSPQPLSFEMPYHQGSNPDVLAGW